MSYVSNTTESKAGNYAVHITTAATQGTATGTADLSSGGATGSLTVTQNSGTATIAITADMDINEIVQAANEEFDKTYTQTLAGSNALLQDDNATAITAQTTWDNIYGTTLQDDDVISFSGTTRAVQP